MSDEFAKDNNLRTAFDLGAGEVKVITVISEGTPFLVIPNDKKVEDIAKFLPPRRAMDERFLDLRSWLAYVKRFRTAELHLSATNGTNPEVTAWFDYLPMPAPEEATPAWSHPELKGARCEHSAVYAPAVSPEWTAWMGIVGKDRALSQREFAEFLDEWGYGCEQPDAATMLELAHTLRANETSTFKSAMRLKDGSGDYAQKIVVETSGGLNGEIKIPDEITLAIPMFEGGPNLAVTLRMRIRVVNAVPKFILLGKRLLDVKRKALQELHTEIEEKTGLTVHVERA